MPEYNVDGPHSPAQTRAAADEIAGLVRYLNYATRDDVPGLEHPGDADRLIAALYTATGRMPQLFSQVEAYLSALAAGGKLRDDHGENPAAVAGVAAVDLDSACEYARLLAERLQSAQNMIASLSLRDGADD